MLGMALARSKGFGCDKLIFNGLKNFYDPLSLDTFKGMSMPRVKA